MNREVKERDYWPTTAWKMSTPEEQNVDPVHLTDLNGFLAGSVPFLRSLLIIRNGYLIYEKYHNGFGENDTQELWSITKSVISCLVGIALEKGHIDGIDERMVDLFPEYLGKDRDIQTGQVLIRHLLDMTSGLTWDNNIYHQWLKSKDLIQFVIDSPMSYQPGEFFFYDDHNPFMLSAILARASGLSAAKYAVRYLFEPLGIKDYKWESNHQGIYCGGYGLFLTARDMAKFGYLYLNDGVWEGRRILTPGWVKESTRQQNQGGSPENKSYGYLWWVTRVNGREAYFAGGYGGQYIYIVPSLDILAVITSSPYANHRENKEIIEKYIFSAARE